MKTLRESVGLALCALAAEVLFGLALLSVYGQIHVGPTARRDPSESIENIAPVILIGGMVGVATLAVIASVSWLVLRGADRSAAGRGRAAEKRIVLVPVAAALVTTLVLIALLYGQDPGLLLGPLNGG